MKFAILITSHSIGNNTDKFITDTHGNKIDLAKTVETLKEQAKLENIITILSTDETVNKDYYSNFFDEILISKTRRQKWVGEREKIHVGFSYCLRNDINVVFKCLPRTIKYDFSLMRYLDHYDIIVNNWQTTAQYATDKFLCNRKGMATFFTVHPCINEFEEIVTHKDWTDRYGSLLLENNFYTTCSASNVKVKVV